MLLEEKAGLSRGVEGRVFSYAGSLIRQPHNSDAQRTFCLCHQALDSVSQMTSGAGC